MNAIAESKTFDREAVLLVLEKAQKAAESAFKDSFDKYGDRDCCGFAWVDVYNVRSNSKLGKLLAEKGFSKSYHGSLQLWSSFPVQSMTPKESGCIAYAQVLRDELGIEAYMGSRMD